MISCQRVCPLVGVVSGKSSTIVLRRAQPLINVLTERQSHYHGQNPPLCSWRPVNEPWATSKPFCKSPTASAARSLSQSSSITDIQVEKMLKKLVIRKDTDHQVHSFVYHRNIVEVARKMQVVGVDIDTVEERLIRRVALPRYNKKHIHFSRHAFRFWRDGARMYALERMKHLYIGLEESKKYWMPIKRVEYFLLMFRMAIIIEEAVAENLTNELKFIEDLCNIGAEKYYNKLLYFYFWLVCAQSETLDNHSRSRRLLKKRREIREIYVKHLDVLEKYFGVNENAMKELPAVFSFAGIEENGPHIMQCFRDIGDEFLEMRTKAYRALHFWRSTKYSLALKELEDLCDYWFSEFENDELMKSLSPSLAITTSLILSDAVEESMKPALKFFDVTCDKISERYGNPLLWYLFWVQLQKEPSKNKELMEKAAQKFPSTMRNEPLERLLCNEENNRIMKMITLKKFFSTLDLKALKQHNRDSIDSQENYAVPTEILSEMLDIKVLECLQKKEIEEAIQVIANKGNKGVMVTEPVLKEILKSLAASDFNEGWIILKQTFPFQSKLSDMVFESELESKMFRNYREYGKKHDYITAIKNVLVTYKKLLEEEFHITDEMLDKLKTKLLHYLRYYVESSIESEHVENVIDLVRTEGLEISTLYDDYSILSYLWEALFFSTSFKIQRMSDTLLQDHPQLRHYLDFDHALARASRFGLTKFFQNLVETSLRYDLDSYQKTRAFEGLLVHHCERGDMKSARNVLDSSKRLDVVIGADAFNIFRALKNEVKYTRGSFDFNFFDLLRGKRNDNNT